jgi:hypothetical protein
MVLFSPGGSCQDRQFYHDRYAEFVKTCNKASSGNKVLCQEKILFSEYMYVCSCQDSWVPEEIVLVLIDMLAKVRFEAYCKYGKHIFYNKNYLCWYTVRKEQFKFKLEVLIKFCVVTINMVYNLKICTFICDDKLN